MAPYNAGARRYGQEPLNYPMMHCVGPSTYRSYTMLANQARYISFYNFGPAYAVTEKMGILASSPEEVRAVIDARAGGSNITSARNFIEGVGARSRRSEVL